MSVTRADLVRALAERMGDTQKDTEKRVIALLEILAAAIAEQGRVELRGFGAFEAREIRAQETVNPRTGKVTQLQASYTVDFKPSQAMKATIRRERLQGGASE